MAVVTVVMAAISLPGGGQQRVQRLAWCGIWQRRIMDVLPDSSGQGCGLVGGLSFKQCACCWDRSNNFAAAGK